eukprot:14699306-Alexandrium_andersonii.AAC.1
MHCWQKRFLKRQCQPVCRSDSWQALQVQAAREDDVPSSGAEGTTGPSRMSQAPSAASPAGVGDTAGESAVAVEAAEVDGAAAEGAAVVRGTTEDVVDAVEEAEVVGGGAEGSRCSRCRRRAAQPRRSCRRRGL